MAVYAYPSCSSKTISFCSCYSSPSGSIVEKASSSSNDSTVYDNIDRYFEAIAKVEAVSLVAANDDKTANGDIVYFVDVE